MFGRLFGAKQPATSVVVIARLNDRAQPIHRGELYEDPLNAVLQEQGLGEVTGGGTQLAEDGEIEFCDIEIGLRDAGEATLTAVRTAFEKLNAPKGSKLIVETSGQELPFGLAEGIAVYLNGTDLPDEVYATCDLDHVFDEFNRLLASDGKVHSLWQGPTETALYMYGPSFEAMKGRLASFLASYPLCQQARVVQVA